ncbi:MAG: hypothetical protein R3F20_13250 [Planctomycetota bacterium]
MPSRSRAGTGAASAGSPRYPLAMRGPLIVLVFVLGLLGACRSGPLTAADRPEPALAAIQTALEAVVARADAERGVHWVHGWDGNDAVKESGEDGTVMGYCWHWQERVLAEMAAPVRAEGWDLVRININRGWFSEHHAVAVWDPERIDRDRILREPRAPVWVLDPWLHGRPEIYALADWLAIPVIVFEPAGLEVPGSP